MKEIGTKMGHGSKMNKAEALLDFSNERQHPSPEVLELFVNQQVAKGDLDTLIRHISFCNRCSEIVYRKKLAIMQESTKEPLYAYLTRIIREKVSDLIEPDPQPVPSFVFAKKTIPDFDRMAEYDAGIDPDSVDKAKEAFVVLCSALEDQESQITTEEMKELLLEELIKSGGDEELLPKVEVLIEKLLLATQD